MTRKLPPQNLPTHGHRRPHVSPTYRTWVALKTRCLNPRHKNHARYAPLWYEPWRSFDVFLADMGVRPDNTSLERTNNALGYGPGNCVWATQTAQQRNRSNNKLTIEIAAAIRASNETGVVLARRYGVSEALVSRIRSNKQWRP